MNFKLGFIGCGNMAQGILKGIFSSENINYNDICIYDTDKKKADDIRAMKSDVRCFNSAEELANNSDIIFLCVKPNIQPLVIESIFTRNKAFISIAAGITSDQLAEKLGDGARYLRIMPNTPLTVGLGATCFSLAHTLTKTEHGFVKNIFESTGIVCEVDEEKMDAVTGISGSGPAYVYYFIDAMAKAGEEQGLSYNDSLLLTLQTIKGSVKMVEKCGKTPAQLKIDVCSPGGTTIEALKVFEENKLAMTISKGIAACTKKSKKLSEYNNG